MRKTAVLLVVLFALAAVTTAFFLIRHRIPHPTTHQTAAPAKQALSPAGIPEPDWRDEKMWEQTPEFESVTNELHLIMEYGDAWNNLTPDQVEVVIRYMHSPHYEARIRAAIAARDEKYPAQVKSSLVPQVVRLLADPVSHVRFWAAGTLGFIGDKDSIPFLIPLLHDDRQIVRKAAQEAISKLESKDAGLAK